MYKSVLPLVNAEDLNKFLFSRLESFKANKEIKALVDSIYFLSRAEGVSLFCLFDEIFDVIYSNGYTSSLPLTSEQIQQSLPLVTDDGIYFGGIYLTHSNPEDLQLQGNSIESLLSVLSKTILFDFHSNESNLIELETSKRHYKNLFEKSLGIMSVHDLDGNILAVNKSGRESLGYNEEDILQLNLKELVPSHKHDLLEDYLKRIQEVGEDSDYLILRTKCGKHTYWHYQNILEYDEFGQPYVISTALNLTEKIHFEKDLRKTQSILEQTSLVAEVGGWEIDIHNFHVNWSDSTRNFFKVGEDFYPSVEIALNFFDEKSKAILSNEIQLCLEGEREFEYEAQIRQNDGNIIWVRIKGISEFDKGECKRIFGIIQNIDEYKQLNLELDKQRKMLESFVQYAPTSMMMLDSKMDCLVVSEQWIQEFQVPENQYVGKNIYDLYPNMPYRLRQFHQKAIQSKSRNKWKSVLSTRNKNLKKQHYDVHVQPWFYDNNELGGVIISVLNITNIIEANKELKIAKINADLANKTKTQFLANMSHEIRTPLNGIIGFSDLLLKNPYDEAQKQYLNYINDSGTSLLNIIHDILDFSKIESGKLELVPAETHLNGLLNKIINVVLYQAHSKNIELLLNIEQDLPKYVFVDESRLRQILINLLGNAVKFTHTGEIELKVHRLEENNENIKLRFSVRDTGIGIPKEKQSRIFEAFSQEDGTISKKYGGTGLGLTISKNILKYMDSTLHVKSELDKGSEFYFDLSLGFKYGNRRKVNRYTSINEIVVISGNKNNLHNIQRILDSRKIHSQVFLNTTDVSAYLQGKKHVDFILFDFDLGGEEVWKQIAYLRSFCSCIIIMHTSTHEKEVLDSIEENKGCLNLLKPIRSEELLAALRKKIRPMEEVWRDMRKTASSDSMFLSIKGTYKILVVDDHPINMALNLRIMNMLMPEAELVSAYNGRESLELCQKHNFDLILMDIQMPEINGIEATKMIRQLDNHLKTPIVGITASIVKGEKERCMEAGMSGFVTKPIRKKDLYDVLFPFVHI